MDFQKLTIKSQEAFAAAQGLALERGNPEITPDHLLVALLDQESSVAGRVLEKAGHPPAAVRAAADERLARLPRVEGGNSTPPASRALRDTLEAAFIGGRVAEGRVRRRRAPAAGAGQAGRARSRRRS